jgi:DNA-binding NtrC family response regulator
MDTNNNFRIFLVDDDIFCLNFYRQHLVNLGYHDITSFENGSECLDGLTSLPDIIFLDHGMDIISGLEMLKKIKRFNPDIYVVFLSGQENIETAVNALKFGAFDYIVKGDKAPENITRVLGKIEEVKELLKVKNPNFIRKILTLI